MSSNNLSTSESPSNRVYLSVIVPLYNEEGCVQPLYKAITDALKPCGFKYEVVLVDDGSCDDTFLLAEQIARKDSRVRVIKFRKNYGQTPAMVAGIEYASGAVLLTMDGDLQNDPADIPAFVRKIDEGYDVVVGWRHDRKDKLLTRKIPSQIANWLIGKITRIPIKDNGCSLKAYRAQLIKHIPLYGEMHRFIPAMTSLGGARLAEIKVRHHPRRYGMSKYGLSRIYKVLLDLLAIKTIIAFAARPLLWFSALALPAGIISIGVLTYGTYELFFGTTSQPEFLTGVGILFGALALMLILGGMLAELVYKTGDTRLERLSLLTLQKLPPRADE